LADEIHYNEEFYAIYYLPDCSGYGNFGLARYRDH
jgi:hypothetical protein